MITPGDIDDRKSWNIRICPLYPKSVIRDFFRAKRKRNFLMTDLGLYTESLLKTRDKAT